MKRAAKVKKSHSFNVFNEKINYRGGNYYTSLLEQVRILRKNQTEAENIFWELVRNKKFMRLKFRRQHQIGTYIVDFYCPSKRLIIEIDGKIHLNSGQREKDISRDQYLTELGNRILRFTNEQIYNEIGGVFHKIHKVVS
ncbi:MAG: endonuclease domain-containing protein [Acidobacteriota bacterium]